ncbi:seven transmembrane domain protein [Cavenderia fasciculata]|uniref:Seven transmembrane domain protein n=1 Tax=Cavenderia fasciculata TaxID=261658 RepID=F4PXI8_CACFS|nr:seven transmembrane domain protein [Cavenderia fasciculata]EGG19498.1 seven transmembrane domain protein [Cavenderia fasciculata]|eukprot:XP_004357792.1 seven transmembrane domain protein [Cavenderia fasciculata]
MKQLLLFICLLLSYVSISYSLKHHLKIENDRRQSFLIEGFGFSSGGVLNASVSNWIVNGIPSTKNDNTAFVIKISDTDGTLYLEDIDYQNCSIPDIYFTNSSEENPFSFVINIANDPKKYPEGFYNLFFVNCKAVPVSFTLDLVEYNIDSNGNINYLSVGDNPLPTVYGLFSIIFAVLLVLWIFVFLRGEGKRVNKIHHLCSVYLVLQAVELLFRSIEMHYIKTTGSANGWDIAYYIFACLQGSFFIVLIALIGTGWTFIKPFLSDKDKTIFMIVIPLQILDNIALIMIDERAPGSESWVSWKHIFTVVDIICCGAIIVPIIWSINHLKDAASADDKAAKSLAKLQLFRQFYVFVISYVYFTRIVVFLVKASLEFHLIWLGDFSTLVASLVFYSATGYQFRPSLDNPYFNVPADDDLEAAGIQLSSLRDDDDD